MPNLPILSFNTGEVTPLIDARSDVAKYASACRILQNMIPRIYGLAQRRPGTKFIKLTQNPNVLSRLIPFIYSEEIAYIVEHGNQSARFYFDGAELVDGDGNHVSIATPYLSADLRDIHYKQSNDVQWLVHKGYIPRKLTRTTATSFSLDTITFTGGPFLKRHDIDVGDGVTLTPSVTTGAGTLTASADTFELAHVGSVWNLTQPRVNTDISGSRTSAGILGTPMIVEGVYTFSTSGTWRGTVRIQRSVDAGVTYETIKTYTQQALYTGTESGNDVLYRINVTSLNSGKIRATLSVNSSTQDGIVRITAFTSAIEVAYTVDKTLASTSATVRWAEGAWSGVRGYPRTMTFFEERTVYASTIHQPQTIWLSASGKFECFKEGTADNDAFSLTLSSDTRNAILWITALEALVFGTSGGEWRLRSSRFDEPLTPTNFSAKQQSTKGSKAIQALQVDSSVLFVDSVGRKVREMSLDSNTGEKYVASDMNALAEHITETRIVAIAHQKNPDSILWAVRTDGVLLSMTYEREQDVVAWARHRFFRGGQAESETFEDRGFGGYQTSPEYPTLQVADGTFQTQFDDPGLSLATGITDVDDLQDMLSDPTGNYYLVNDIDATETAEWNAGAGFLPIPNFSGTFDGRGYKITGLTINRPTVNRVGLFALSAPVTSDVIIANVTLNDCNIAGKSLVGALCGDANWDNAPTSFHTVIQNCHVGGDSTIRLLGSSIVRHLGGLVGQSTGGAIPAFTHNQIRDCTVDATVHTMDSTDTVIQSVGGFIGEFGDTTITNCRSSGVVIATVGTQGGREVGGFVGHIDGSEPASNNIIDCSTDTIVTGWLDVGGFVGKSDGATITRCSARGNVNGKDNVGGFVGDKFDSTEITDCYSWGNVSASDGTFNFAGGFVQQNGDLNNGITNAYSIGLVTGDFIGGFAQFKVGTQPVTAAFWDTETSGTEISNGGVGHTTEWMQKQLSYENEGWDFNTVWSIPTPVLWSAYWENLQEAVGLGVNSVAVIPGDGEDEVWLIVGRVINGQLRRMIEQMQPRDFGNQEDAWFCDAALDYDGVATDSFTGLDHLEGEEVAIWGNGAIFTRKTVVDGSVTLDSPVTRAIVGLPFRYILKPMRFDLQMRSGTTKGSMKKIGEAAISFYQTLMARYGKDVNHLLSINWRTTEPYDSPPALHTGDKIAVADGGYDPEDGFIITGDDPAPCSIRSIVLREKITGR